MLPTLPSVASMSRERRQWTAQEDELLKLAVGREEPGNPAPSKWHAIAQHVPNRTNKDCRKRWYAKMSSDVVKGGWAPDEDQRLLSAIESFGTRWSVVASMVQTRNSDQCAKRWSDTLNPAIDRTAWTAEADDLLIQAVNEQGKVWTKIVHMYFPGRTGLAAKNRYNSITRAEGSSRGSSRRRHSPESSPSPPLELDYADARSSQYPGHSSVSRQGYHPMANPSQHSRSHSTSQLPLSGYAGSSRGHSSTMSFQPTNPNSSYPMTNPSYSQPPQGYFSTSNTRYPSSSQYQGPPPLPGNNQSFPDYSLHSSQYPQQQVQYPNTAYNSGYSVKYPGGGTTAPDPARNTSDPRNWGPY